MNTFLKIGGMTCQNCVRHVREALQEVPGVKSAEVDLGTGRAQVTWDGAAPEPASLVEAVERAGYTVVGAPE